MKPKPIEYGQLLLFYSEQNKIIHYCSSITVTKVLPNLYLFFVS